MKSASLPKGCHREHVTNIYNSITKRQAASNILIGKRLEPIPPREGPRMPMSPMLSTTGHRETQRHPPPACHPGHAPPDTPPQARHPEHATPGTPPGHANRGTPPKARHPGHTTPGMPPQTCHPRHTTPDTPPWAHHPDMPPRHANWGTPPRHATPGMPTGAHHPGHATPGTPPQLPTGDENSRALLVEAFLLNCSYRSSSDCFLYTKLHLPLMEQLHS